MLAAVEPKSDQEWPAEALKWFENYTSERDFYAMKLTEVGHHSCITLLDTANGKTVDVREALRDAGWAKFQVQLS